MAAATRAQDRDRDVDVLLLRRGVRVRVLVRVVVVGGVLGLHDRTATTAAAGAADHGVLVLPDGLVRVVVDRSDGGGVSLVRLVHVTVVRTGAQDRDRHVGVDLGGLRVRVGVLVGVVRVRGVLALRDGGGLASADRVADG